MIVVVCAGVVVSENEPAARNVASGSGVALLALSLFVSCVAALAPSLMADTDDQKPVAAPADAAAAEVPAGTLDAAAEAKKAKAKAKKKAAKAKKKSAAPPAAASGAAASSSSSGTSGTVDHPVRVPGTYEPVGAPSSAPPSALLLGEEASAELRHFAAAISLPSHDPSIDPDASKLIKKTAAPAEAVSHRFWSTQPVIQSGRFAAIL